MRATVSSCSLPVSSTKMDAAMPERCSRSVTTMSSAPRLEAWVMGVYWRAASCSRAIESATLRSKSAEGLLA
jgi:hypothetical protein